MKRLISHFLTILSIIPVSCDKSHSPVTINTIACHAPFEMPPISYPDFTNCERLIITENVLNFDAE